MNRLAKSNVQLKANSNQVGCARFARPLSALDYDQLCRAIRFRIINMSHRAKAPHLASAMSCVELVSALYGSILNIDPKHPSDQGRDRFIFSKGHAASTLYTALAFFGFFSEEELETYGLNNSNLAEQPSPYCMPGVEAATGSLGHGLPMGVGMAKAAQITNRSYKTFVLMSDGECNEGSVWEAALIAPAQRLGNLIAIVDFNKWQATGRSEEVTALSPLKQKWQSFGWNSCEIDGHDVGQIIATLAAVDSSSDRPTAVIANTVKGKGISFMEDDNNWHYRIPTEAEIATAKLELGV